MLRVVLTILNVVLAVTYPLAVWWSLTHTSARNTGLLVMLVLIPGIALTAEQMAIHINRHLAGK